MGNLLLHCGAEQVNRDDPILSIVPERKGRFHKPIPHADFINLVEKSLQHRDLEVRNAVYGAVGDGSRMFGLLELDSGHQDYSTVIGLRASHDQRIAAGIVAGSQVLVCDNLCFSGEVKLTTRQTTHLMDRLPLMVDEAITKTGTLIDQQNERFGQYKDVEIDQDRAYATITKMVMNGAINQTSVKQVVQEWDEPSHDEFKEGSNVWRLMNAVTETYKPTNGHTNMRWLPRRSRKLTETCDELVAMAEAA